MATASADLGERHRLCAMARLLLVGPSEARCCSALARVHCTADCSVQSSVCSMQ